jgi:mono/diheme cytochrome c family protein
MFRGTRLELFSIAVLPLGLVLAVHGAPGPAMVDDSSTQLARAGDVSFSSQIAPMFEEYCVSCHGAETQEAGLRLDSYEAVMAGSEYGAVVEAGSPDNSLLLDMVAAGEMPQEEDPWDEDQVDLVRSWIADGAEDN